ncbi:MAG: HAMP domain-containing protein, partial [Desulfobulbaceae bacterium]|nr:HAMP domain-containing protein [Desulfobulbaceae bacterium]
MLIRTRLKLGTVIIIVTLVMTGMTIHFLDRSSQRFAENHDVAQRLAEDMSELVVLTYDNLLNQSQRAHAQWKAMNSRIKQDFEYTGFHQAEHQRIFAGLQTDLTDIELLFEQLIHPLHKNELTDQGKKILGNRLLIKVLSLSSQAFHLLELCKREAQTIEVRKQAVTWISLAALGLIPLVIFLRLGRSLGRPLQRLSKAISQVGLGRLDYRADIRTNDELGALSHTFDQMTHRLKTLTVSRTELEKEVGERKRVNRRIERL